MFSIDQEGGNGDAMDVDPYLFDSSAELLPLTNGGADTEFSLKGENVDGIPFNNFDNLDLYEHYQESGPSSVQIGDLAAISERGGSHMSIKDEGDGSVSTATSVPNQVEAGSASCEDAAPYTSSTANNVEVSQELRNADEVVIQPEHESAKVAPQAQQEMHVSTGSEGQGLHSKPSRERDSFGDSQGRSDRRSYVLTRDASKTDAPNDTHLQRNSTFTAKRVKLEGRPKSSIPASLHALEFARQCILAAYSSRLNPFALHPGEYKLLREHVTRSQVTVYLNIRNAILRLWTRNPLLSVTKEEALGCARESRYFNLADISFQWLLRHGYINFGCLEVPDTSASIFRPRARSNKRRTILIVGAGVSGLSCARQLEGLCAQLGNRWTSVGERPPKIVILEGRNRIGGRVYSHSLKSKSGISLPPGLRSTAEMGAQIVTGFEHGNPLNIVIRGQLALHCHALKDNSILYDYDGNAVEKSRDVLVEKLYNDILERASAYRTKSQPIRTFEADRELIELGRDPSSDNGPVIAMLEEDGASVNTARPMLGNVRSDGADHVPPVLDKLAGRAYVLNSSSSKVSAAEAAQSMGWQLKPNVSPQQSIDLKHVAEASDFPTLGEAMDEGIRQYQELLELTPLDMRLLNWHHANLEYANAVNVNQLSLGGWDQDIGNEFEGEHSEIIGGYAQFPRGLWQCPKKLDIRFKSIVKTIDYSHSSDDSKEKPVRVHCEGGQTFEADRIVISTPLGVLKAGTICFEPALPNWKATCIERLGFGVLNKVVLVYERAFWEEQRDMFGLLNEGNISNSLNQGDYGTNRGRFYLFWNCLRTSGQPVLVALMAGDAALATEEQSSEMLIRDVTARLAKIFAPKNVPEPLEVVITRWKRDPFAGGSYSYMGPKTLLGDYDIMAHPVDTLHFAGEATCGTHPATVHGAYLSGLRAASEVIESLLGPIQIPEPLVPPKPRHDETPTSVGKRKFDESQQERMKGEPAKNEEYEAAVIGAILAEIGERPMKPDRTTANPYLLFQKDHWIACKTRCDEVQQKATGNPAAKASRNEVRSTLGQMWREAALDVKQPYLKRAQSSKEVTTTNMTEFKNNVASWDRDAARIRKEYMDKNPPPEGYQAPLLDGTIIENWGRRRNRRINDYAEDADGGQ